MSDRDDLLDSPDSSPAAPTRRRLRTEASSQPSVDDDIMPASQRRRLAFAARRIGLDRIDADGNADDENNNDGDDYDNDNVGDDDLSTKSANDDVVEGGYNNTTAYFEEEDEGENLQDTAVSDYQAITALDTYDATMVDDRQYDRMTNEERRRAEEELDRLYARRNEAMYGETIEEGMSCSYCGFEYLRIEIFLTSR